MVMLSLLLVAGLVTTATAAPFPAAREHPRLECPEGWTLIDGTCYLFATSQGTWYQGRSCNHAGDALATVLSQTRQNAISVNLRGNVWIGLGDLSRDDGSVYRHASWDGGEPNNERAFLFALGEEEDCVEMRGRVAYTWNDARADKTRWFLCRKPPQEITTTTTTTLPTTTTPTTTPTTTTTTTTTTTAPPPVCEEGWEMFEGTTCYKVSDTKASWPQARDACVAEGAQLAAITSEAQQNFLAARTTQDTWIGLNDISQEGTFTWQDGTAPEYTKWEVTEPNNAHHTRNVDDVGEDCSAMFVSHGHKWFDDLCTRKKKFACQKAPSARPS